MSVTDSHGSSVRFTTAEAGKPISSLRLWDSTWGSVVTGRPEAFRLLGITPNATEAEVRAAFRRKLIEHHPDTAVPGTDESTVRRLIDAYHLLVPLERRTDLNPPVIRRDEPGPGPHRINIRSGPTELSQSSPRRQRRCPECMATGVRVRVITCPDCGGGSVLTTLDIGQVRVSRCRGCRGQGRVRSLEQCRACGGTGMEEF